MWLVTPHFCHCTCTVLLMTNLYRILFILFWEVLVQSESLFTVKYFCLFTFSITLCKTCAVSPTWVSHLHFNVYRIWPELLNSVILVRVIIFYLLLHHLYVAIYCSKFFFLSVCLFTFQQSMCISFIYSLHKGHFPFSASLFYTCQFASSQLKICSPVPLICFATDYFHFSSLLLFPFPIWDYRYLVCNFLFAFCHWISLHLVFIISHILNLSLHCETRSIPAQFSTFHLLEILPNCPLSDLLYTMHCKVLTIHDWKMAVMKFGSWARNWRRD